MYDIAIIGAGPAGSILARQLNKKYKDIIKDTITIWIEKRLIDT